MPFSRNMRLLIDGFDFSLDTNGLSISNGVESVEVATLQSNAVQHMPIEAIDQVIEHTGYYSGPAAGQIEAELYARLGSGNPALVAVLLDTTGHPNPAVVAQATWGKQLKIDAPLKDLITVAGSWPASPLRRGKTLVDGVVNAGASPSRNFGVAGAAGGSAFLFVRAINGATTGITVQLQGATDAGFTTPVTLGTWSTFTQTNGYTLNFGGTVHQYLRLNVTALGGASNLTAAAFVCVAGGVTE